MKAQEGLLFESRRMHMTSLTGTHQQVTRTPKLHRARGVCEALHVTWVRRRVCQVVAMHTPAGFHVPRFSPCVPSELRRVRRPGLAGALKCRCVCVSPGVAAGAHVAEKY